MSETEDQFQQGLREVERTLKGESEAERANVAPTALLCCPFCGRDELVQLHHNGLDLYSVSCAGCEVHMEQNGGGWIEKEEAISAWNTRAI